MHDHFAGQILSSRFLVDKANSVSLAFCPTTISLTQFSDEVGLGGTPIIGSCSIAFLANGMSLFPSMSKYGRFVAFLSDASNLVVGDTNGSTDIFVFDKEEKRGQVSV